MNEDKLLVSFDWIAKHLSRNKANCEVVEGFLEHDIKIINVMGSKAKQR
jgi:molybdopterin-guanine dinucleotide biosynthesis protein